MSPAHLTIIPTISSYPYPSPRSIYSNTPASSAIGTLAADIDSLRRILTTRDTTARTISEALKEYAWRGVLRGTRVRDWCEGLRTVLDHMPIGSEIHMALSNVSNTTLFPFLSLHPTRIDIHPQFLYPPSTLSSQTLGLLDSDTLVDALLTLLDAPESTGEIDLIAPVTELVLEYIGTVWRRMIMNDTPGIADGIAKALVELEFELQCQGSQSSLRSLIFPIVRRIRFNLGFVTSFQLVSRLKSHADNLSSCDPDHIITSFALRRLNSGTTSQKVYDELLFIRERVRDSNIQNIVESVRTRLGLERNDSPTESDMIPILLPPTPTKKVFSLFTNKKALSRKTMFGTPLPSSARDPNFLGYPNGFNPDRRPSLPNFSPSHHLLGSPLKSTSLTSFQSTDSTDSKSSITSDLLSQILSLNEASHARLILLDYLVDMRYKLSVGGEGDWYFGGGRENAARVLDNLEGRLVGKRDVMDLGLVFGELRTQFDIPLSTGPNTHIRSQSRTRPTPQSPLSPSTSIRQAYTPNTPQSIDAWSVRSRNPSSDIDSYYHHSIPEDEDDTDNQTIETHSDETIKANRKSLRASSQFSFSSHLSSSLQHQLSLPDHGDNRSSFISNYAFSIKEARVGYAQEAITLDPSSPSPSPSSPYLDVTNLHSRSESALDEGPANLNSPGMKKFLARMSRSNTPGSTSSHLSVPRSNSPAGSFHSLLSALDLETRIPVDLMDIFLDTTILSPPITPLAQTTSFPSGPSCSDLPIHGSTTSSRTSTPTTTSTSAERRRQNRQCVVVDNLNLSPDGKCTDLDGIEFCPDVNNTPEFEPTRRRFTSAGTSTSTLDSIDELTSVKPGDLPLAGLLGLFVSDQGMDRWRGPKEGTRVKDVEYAVEAFIWGEMKYADELGEGWDGEDQRRVVWLLRQIVALIPDPELQYPLQQQILYLTRNPPIIRSSQISTSSSYSTPSSTRSPYTPKHSSTDVMTPNTSPAGPDLGYSLGVTLGSPTVDMSIPFKARTEAKGQRERESMISDCTFGVGGMGRVGGNIKGYELDLPVDALED